MRIKPEHTIASFYKMIFCRIVIILFLLGTAFGHAQGDLVIYSDHLESGWQSWSWNTTVDFSSTAPVHSGTAAISATLDQPWAGLYLHHDTNINASSFDTLRFYIHGDSSSGNSLKVMLADGGNTLIDSSVVITSQANTWSQIDVPLADLGSPSQISGVAWQDTSGAAQPVFHLDDIKLMNSGMPPPAPVTGPLLTVNRSIIRHAISPYIYGINFADPLLASDLRLPVNRWGGNATTRYNYLTDTSNRASDWFFENIPNDNAHPENLPAGSAVDHFISQNKATTTQSLITLPLIGWTPKSREYACGFSVSKYGPQQYTDPWRPDCGNGIRPDGTTPVTGNAPADTSISITPVFVQSWMTHLAGEFGNAAGGGVRLFNLDNEPMLWHHTHRDVHPDPVSYNEIRDRSFSYGAAIKTTDPDALTLGPVLWGWTAYFYSAVDAQSGNWANPPDRNAHGGTPFVPWYLQQMRAYEQQHGVRILDYLDLHFYPQGGQALTTAGNADLQALRLRSTRGLWDPAYTDESWIGEPVRLIPRMREWVANNYPGTRLAISEYNWGGLEHINGALAQADILGIFGREGLDLATLWDPPASDSPGSFAFRMYRNYDGQGSHFGDQSILAISSDQDRLSIYAARRNSDNALTVMIINKTADTLKSPLTLSGVSGRYVLETYRYSGDDTTRIVHLPDRQVNPSLSEAFPPRSITLLVAHPGRQTGKARVPYLLLLKE